MFDLGSVSRDEASRLFSFLAPRLRGRRAALRAFTHRDPDFVFWIAPDGALHDARDSHLANPPKGHEHIVHDAPDYGGFLRGRVASSDEAQLVVVYCRSEALATAGAPLAQLLKGLAALPVPLSEGALVVSDNADLYGTVADLEQRHAAASVVATASRPNDQ